MEILKTERETLSGDEILKYIFDYEIGTVPDLDKLWDYYKAKNTTILGRKAPDPNNPDNKTPISYGRKIVTTFTGYAYRPRYVTYKAEDEAYMAQLQDTYNLNNEHIKTSRAGRNTAIFGVAYEALYIDGVTTMTDTLPIKAEPRFFAVDPREMILLYDYSPEPKKKIAIRFYRISDDFYKVEVYYADRIEKYDRVREMNRTGEREWRLVTQGQEPNFFEAVPIVPYYFGDEMLGVIKPVLPLIDDYDSLVSDSINEFDRFANAYLLLVKMSLADPGKNKEPGAINRALQLLKRRRVFEQLPSSDAVSFLTKDIPTEFVEFMTDLVRRQIHAQSHVPDFSDKTFASEISGVAVQRLMFDFENVVSSAEADFDIGLTERMRLINTIYAKAGERTVIPIYDVTISHKRNVPLNLKEFADIALTMKNAGFSAYLIADVMPDDIIPDVQAELDRQEEERQAMIPDVDEIPPPEEEDEVIDESLTE